MLIDYRSQLETPPRESALVLDSVILRPGNNEVIPTQWKKSLSNPVLNKKIQDKIDKGIILIRSEKDASQNLRELTVTDASKIISETFDIPLLEQWLEHDTRKGIHRDIEEQIAKIKEAGTGAKEEDEK